MLIRQATLLDIEPIMQLVKAVVPLMIQAGNFQWDDAYPNPVVFEKDLQLQQLWLAEIDGAIAGIAAITTDQEPEYAKVGWDINETAIVIHRLAVHPAYQGKGVAVALLQEAELIAADRNIHILRVDTNSMNKATQTLFPKLGYVFAGEIDLSFRPGLLFYCYEKRF
ncbi:GNAT family N-acetyltransferase [Pedobacter frigiditerrae]|uniref:GNAT family N-acetyltransferase n=1 Tax=Pedobacter frigiditerrae TaxID=2530452 RepID=A0A4V2MIG8_9SPHI|nr:GNAT family N-acetyltransferase [Pedobacter frigiditerrae]TCC90356.1 GNAT family N-acetyltransferase [Pedobacter frigiditerrae]